MKRINNIIVSLLVSFAIATSASAGALSVSGSAKATYGTMSGEVNGDNTIGIANELAFGASGELDNGWTWKYQTEIDPSAGAATADAVTDDSNLNITTPYGTVAICVSECGLSAALNFSADAYVLMSDTGYGEGKVEPSNISSYANMQYHTPSGLLPFGIVGKIAYAPSGSTNMNSSNAQNTAKSATVGNTTMYRIEAAPIDGLALNISYSESDGADVAGLTDEQKDEGGAIAGKYTTGPFTIGVGKAYSAIRLADGTATDSAESYINTNYSLGYSIGDNMSVSYTKEKSVQDKMTAATVTYDQTTSSVQAAYTMGGMTLAIARADYDNVGYANNIDAVETIFAVTMAF